MADKHFYFKALLYKKWGGCIASGAWAFFSFDILNPSEKSGLYSGWIFFSSQTELIYPCTWFEAYVLLRFYHPGLDPVIYPNRFINFGGPSQPVGFGRIIEVMGYRDSEICSAEARKDLFFQPYQNEKQHF